MRRLIIIVLGLLIIVGLSLYLLWSTNNANNERQLNEDLAERFDETMYITYPFLEKISEALYVRVDILEKNATYAHDNYPLDYKDAFRQLNIMSSDTEPGAFSEYWMKEYCDFFSSTAYGHLEGAGELRTKERSAFIKLYIAYSNPHGALDMDYDSLLQECKNIKIAIQESLRDLAKYRTTNKDINAWRYVQPMKYNHIFKRYYERKNWPFNIWPFKKKRR